MAKGNAMGLWKGKKGSSVFYKIWNSNNKEKQGIREYQPNVSNPQTDIQVDQRMKMLPAQLVKGALRDIVSRSFQGVPYGSKSRLEFMKYALRAEIVPYLPKGWTDPVPGSYLISRGTLPPIGVRFDDNIPGFRTNIGFNMDVQNNTTIGDFSSEILGNNPQFHEGDQLTFVSCNYWTEYLNSCEWAYFSVILDSTNAEAMKTLKGFSRIIIGRDSEYLYFSGPSDNSCAAGIIHSRLGSDGLYLRSNCEIALADTGWSDEFDSYFTPTAAGEARRSYQKKTTTRAEDWPVQSSDEAWAGGEIIDSAYLLTGLTGDQAVLNGQEVKVRAREATGRLVAVYAGQFLGEPCLIRPNGEPLTYSAGQDVTALVQEDVPALADLPAIAANSLGRTLTAPSPTEPETTPEPAAEEKKAKKKK